MGAKSVLGFLFRYRCVWGYMEASSAATDGFLRCSWCAGTATLECNFLGGGFLRRSGCAGAATLECNFQGDLVYPVLRACVRLSGQVDCV